MKPFTNSLLKALPMSLTGVHMKKNSLNFEGSEQVFPYLDINNKICVRLQQCEIQNFAMSVLLVSVKVISFIQPCCPLFDQLEKLGL